jgi:uncharacterized membrane protein
LPSTPAHHHRRHRALNPRHALTRVAVSLATGAASYAVAARFLPSPAAPLLGWDAAGLVLLGMSWALFATADADLTRTRAADEDPGRRLVYFIVIFSSVVSILAATAMVATIHDLEPGSKHLMAALCLVAVVDAWALTHTAFTFRYAHLYYREDAEGIGGVDFPGGHPPAYFDFAYFAFTVGMCFQVSDACVSSAQIRRSVLLHAVISFAYNSILLAFVLNLVFGAA